MESGVAAALCRRTPNAIMPRAKPAFASHRETKTIRIARAGAARFRGTESGPAARSVCARTFRQTSGCRFRSSRRAVAGIAHALIRCWRKRVVWRRLLAATAEWLAIGNSESRAWRAEKSRYVDGRDRARLSRT